MVKKAYPWVKEPVLLDILGLKLETKDLPKLIPPRYRPKGRIATNGITGTSVLIDTANSTTTIIEPDNPAHDKEITDIKVILAILNVYAGIRAAYDTVQGTQMGIAINAHATRLALGPIRSVLLQGNPPLFHRAFRSTPRVHGPHGLDSHRSTTLHPPHAPTNTSA